MKNKDIVRKAAYCIIPDFIIVWSQRKTSHWRCECRGRKNKGIVFEEICYSIVLKLKITVQNFVIFREKLKTFLYSNCILLVLSMKGYFSFVNWFPKYIVLRSVMSFTNIIVIVSYCFSRNIFWAKNDSLAWELNFVVRVRYALRSETLRAYFCW